MFFFLFLYSMSFNTPQATYYEGINKAELYITRQDYKDALRWYDSAFARQPTGLGQDLYNAALCALETGNEVKALELCRGLAAKGVRPDFFERKACFARLRKSKTWPDFIKAVKHLNEDFRNRNKDMLAFMDYLAARADDMHAAVIAYNNNDSIRNEAAWRYDSLSQVLLGHLQEQGYPSEEQIGVWITGDTVLRGGPRFLPIMTNRPPLVNLRFNPAFRQLFQETGVQKGLLKPEHCLQLMMSGDLDGNRIQLYYTLYGCDLYKTTTLSEADANTRRLALGMSTVKDYLEKILFAYRHPGKGFSFNLFIYQQKGLPESKEEAERYARDHALVKSNLTSNCY